MTFDIHEPLFAKDGAYHEERARQYEQALGDQFAASAEGEALLRQGIELGWSQAMLHYALTYMSATPPTMTPSDLAEVVFGLFPEKVVTELGDGTEIILELRAFWEFLQRAYNLPQSQHMLELLTPQAARQLERKLQDPTTFGMAKSFITQGKAAGYNMESEAGMHAWVEAFNTTVVPHIAVSSPQHSRPKAKSSRTVTKNTLRAQRLTKKPHTHRES